MATRKYDILVWGATGFTGSRLAQYLAKNAPPRTRIALGGRNKEKLEEIRRVISKAHPEEAEKMDLLVGDSNDIERLREIVKLTKVVASTVGPYSIYGSDLVRACVEEKTDYCDITGEANWAQSMHKELNDRAVQNNTHIVPFCGFDSIPADLGTFMLVNYAKEKLNMPLVHVKASITGLNGGYSGGTLETMANEIAAYRSRKTDKEKTTDKNEKPERQIQSRFKYHIIHYDYTLENWQVFWVMSLINKRVVHWADDVLNYGPNFSYFESLTTHSSFQAGMIVIGLAYLAVLMAFDFTRNILKALRIIPKPGEGPSDEQIENGYFSFHLEGYTEDDRKVYGKVVGTKDPGYGETIKYIAESALCLAFDRNESFRPGIYPPSVIMGHTLLDRLRKKGCKFSADDKIVPARGTNIALI